MRKHWKMPHSDRTGGQTIENTIFFRTVIRKDLIAKRNRNPKSTKIYHIFRWWSGK